jgi:hypothetical protein
LRRDNFICERYFLSSPAIIAGLWFDFPHQLILHDILKCPHSTAIVQVSWNSCSSGVRNKHLINLTYKFIQSICLLNFVLHTFLWYP